MNWRWIAPLGLLAIGLGAYIFLVEHRTLSRTVLDERKGALLPAFVVDKVSRIEIARHGQRIAFVRKFSPSGAPNVARWNMIYPRHSALDKQAIDTLISELEWVEPLRRLNAIGPRDLDRFGLALPRLRVRFWVLGKPHRLVVGIKEPRGQGYYALGDDRAVAFVVGKEFVETLARPSSAYVQRAEVPASDAGVTVPP
ncbi:MAG: DUF4340 domain-containing protein [Myxococcales bacterium]|nr:DUF4340 domain-containing protein [Myxococcales bacterium]MCB9709488.1 DUF4340 domain-containing protein [Myxococcales bacterium]